MPIHDWTRVESGIFHDFHLAWLGNIRTQLNSGLLPDAYYALAEQIAGGYGPDVLTLATPTDSTDGTNSEPSNANNNGGVALATAPPKVRFTMQPTVDPYVAKQRTLTIRHNSNHRIVAIIEVLSRGNKADRHGIRAFREKICAALRQGIHVLLLDLWPPTPRDPQGIHGLIWNEIVGDAYEHPLDKPLTFVAYRAGLRPTAYVEPLAVGDTLSEMPLFLNEHEYLPLPLEPSYMADYVGVPRFYRNILERP